MQTRELYFLWLVPIAALSIIVSIIFPGMFSIEEITLYLTIIGLIYGLVIAFVISIAWDRYGKIRENLNEEISSEMNLYQLVKHFSDKGIAKKISKQLLNYITSVIKVPWNEYSEASTVHQKFERLFEILGRTELKNGKDEKLFEGAFEELRDIETAQTAQIVLSQTPLSSGIWGLLLLLSNASIMGIFLVDFNDLVLGMITKTIMAVSFLALLLVLHQIDSLQLASKQIEEAPSNRLISILKKDLAK